MNPQDAAKQLIDDFNSIFENDEGQFYESDVNRIVKKSAMLTIDKILTINGAGYIPFNNYWNDVKNEINNNY
jgi:hypothetical protein